MRRTALLIAVAMLSLFGVARAETVSGGNVRISFSGSITPNALPRSEAAPVTLHVSGSVTPVNGARPVALERVTVEVNRHASATTRGLPTCPWHSLISTTTARALEICRDSLIGTGTFTSHVDIPDQSPFPADGRLLAFVSRRNGKQTIAAHVYGKDPVPTSEVLPMTIGRQGQGSFGPIVAVQMPDIGNEWGYVTGFDITLKRRYTYRGRPMSVISASCPAPSGVRRAPFKAARGIYDLADGTSVTRTLSGSCRVSG